MPVGFWLLREFRPKRSVVGRPKRDRSKVKAGRRANRSRRR